MSQKKVEKNYSDYLEILFGFRALETQEDQDNTLLDTLPVYFWIHDACYSIVHANQAVTERFGLFQGRKCYEYFMGKNTICNYCPSKSILEGGHDRKCTHCRRSNNTFDLNIYHVPFIYEDGKKYIIKCNIHFQKINFLDAR